MSVLLLLSLLGGPAAASGEADDTIAVIDEPSERDRRSDAHHMYKTSVVVAVALWGQPEGTQGSVRLRRLVAPYVVLGLDGGASKRAGYGLATADLQIGQGLSHAFVGARLGAGALFAPTLERPDKFLRVGQERTRGALTGLALGARHIMHPGLVIESEMAWVTTIGPHPSGDLFLSIGLGGTLERGHPLAPINKQERNVLIALGVGAGVTVGGWLVLRWFVRGLGEALGGVH